MRKVLWGLGALFILGGCAGNDLILSGHQDTLTHVGHWERMAENTAVEINGCLRGEMRPLDFFAQLAEDSKNLLPARGPGASDETVAQSYGRSESGVPYCWGDTDGLADRKIFIAQGDRSTGFGRNFRSFLMSELTALGNDVVNNPENALLVKFHLDAVIRDKQVPGSVPGFFSLAAFTSWVFRGDEVITGVIPTKFAQIGAPVAAGLLADSFVAHEFGGPQLVVTTSLLDGSRVLMRNANGYFISDADLAQYVGPLGPLPERSTEQIATAPEVATLSVVEE